MTSLFFATNDRQLPTGVLNNLVAQLTPAMQTKAGKLRRWQDAQAYVLGKLLILHALRSYDVHLNLQHVKYNYYGRPYVNGGVDVNLSHSGKYVTCIASDECRVGIDIEEIKPVNINDLKAVFNAAEWTQVTAACAGGNYRRLYEYWTLKEAAIKADGRGMMIEPCGLTIQDDNILVAGKPWLFMQAHIAGGYTACIVSSAKITLPAWQQIEVRDLCITGELV